MSAALPAYSDYRDSGLPWLGHIPTHWDVRRNGRLFGQRNETGHGHLPILEVSLRTGVRVRDMENAARKQVMQQRDKYKRAAHGDIAYNMMRLWQGAVGIAPEDGLVSPAYVVARPYKETDGRYYAYLFRTQAYMREVNKYSRGIVSDRNRLYWDEFKQMPSVFPPPDEQRAIANYLDGYGRLVNRFIRNKRQLIERLNEQKQALIHRVVTRGLNPNVRLKSSGIEWLANVPEHWDLLKLKWVANFNPSRLERGKQAQDIGLVPFLPMERVGVEGQINPEMRQYSEVSQGYTYFRRSDVVVAKITPCFENGKGACLHDLPSDYGFGTTEFIVLRAKPALLPEFLYQLTKLKVFRLRGAEAMTGAAGQQRVPLDFVKNFIVPCPPLDEQRELLQWISDQTKEIDLAIGGARREIALVREYRDRLISDVVTGQVDVRALPVPADGEPEPADVAGLSLEGEELEEIAEGSDADD